MPADRNLNLKKDFASPTYEEWKTIVQESIKNTPFEKLMTQTYEGIDLQPIYTKEDIKDLVYLDQPPGVPGYLRGATAKGYVGQPWEICQEIHTRLAPQFNEILKYNLQQGQTGINILLDHVTQEGLDSDQGAVGEVGGGGIAISCLQDFAVALAAIKIEKYPLHISAGFSGLEVIMMLNALFKQQGKEINRVKGSIDTDPLGYLVTHGQLPVSLEVLYDYMAKVTGWAGQHAPHLKTIGISGLPYHNAGADAVRELAYVLATAVEYIDELLKRDVTIDDIAGQMRFTFGIGPFYFMEIARLRAARMLWAKIVAACGGGSKAQKMTIHARTSSYNQTRYDPYVNMLRTTTEAFSAVVAGVDSLHTNAFNEVFGNEDEFSRRVARNTQVLLHEECRLDQLIDPAGGSYYVEKLTHQVSQRAWELFQEIEAMGGMYKALEKGFPQEETAVVHEKRKQDITQRKSIIVGTNYSVNEKEKKLENHLPDYEEIFRIRNQFLQQYRGSRSAEQKSEIAEKLSALTGSLASGIDKVIKAGAEAFLSGATLGEVTAAIDDGNNQKLLRGVQGGGFLEKSPPGRRRQGLKIKSLDIQRAVEIFEKQRDMES